MDARVQRLDPAVEDLREFGDVADRGRRHTGSPERGQRAAGRDDLVAEVDEPSSQLGDPCLVIDAQQRPHRQLRGLSAIGYRLSAKGYWGDHSSEAVADGIGSISARV